MPDRTNEHELKRKVGAAAAVEELTWDDRQRLASLAVAAQVCNELETAFGEASELMSAMVQHHPEFQGPSSELVRKARDLGGACAVLAQEVTAFALSFEQAVETRPLPSDA